jgi:putative ABC transport system permease protein
VGTEVELNGEKMLIAGTYTLGAGLSAGGAAILNATTLQQIAATLQSDRISLGLITLEPSADPERVAEELRGVLNQDVDLLTRNQVIRDELTHWIDETNYGLIFQAGVFVSLIVGIAIVYQVLASDVASLLPEYATLKAMGYSDRQLALVLLQQSLLLAVVGYLLAAVIALVLYGVTTAGAGIPVAMTGQNLLLVFVLAVVMCVSSGLAALRKVFQADPADLF